MRYNIFKRAQGRCELCGIPHEERALDVDHILPRSEGGTDDPDNLQALYRGGRAGSTFTDPEVATSGRPTPITASQ